MLLGKQSKLVRFTITQLKALGSIFLIFIAYSLVASLFSGIDLKPGQLAMEIPLVMLSSIITYNALGKPFRFRAFWAIYPWLVVYSLIDFHLWALGRTFRIVDTGELPELVSVLPATYVIGALFITASLLALMIIRYKRIVRRILFFSLAPALVTASWSVFGANTFVSTFKTLSSGIAAWDEVQTVETNGRWLSTLYFEAERKENLLKLNPKKDWYESDITKRSARLAETNKRNVHIIVMESMLDPLLLDDFKPPKDYLTPWFRQLSSFKNLSISPVFGGQTPQAEFEILCGAAAEQKLGTIEFNSFIGSPTSCMPQWFKQAGWQTVAMHGFKPSFFNRVNAYRGLGFQEAYFPKEYSQIKNSPLSHGLNNTSGIYMYDGDFLKQSVESFKRLRDLNPEAPIFNYMLGVYGHFSFHLDEKRHPPVVDLQDENWSYLERIINQYYYRTREIEATVKELINTDPNALVLVISDHLPPLKAADKLYQQKGLETDIHANVFYLWNRGKPVKIEGEISHFMIPELIFELLEGGQCRSASCLEQEHTDHYDQILAHAMRLSVQ